MIDRIDLRDRIFKHFDQEYDLPLLEGQLDDIIQLFAAPEPDLCFRLDIKPPTVTNQSAMTILYKHNKKFSERLFNKHKPSTYPRVPFIGKMGSGPGKAAKDLYLLSMKPHAPSQPLLGPLELTIRWDFPFRATEKKAVMISNVCIPKGVSPDLDNMCKIPMDCMTDLNFWNDDGQVFNIRLQKWWSHHPGLTVTIRKFQEPKPKDIQESLF